MSREADCKAQRCAKYADGNDTGRGRLRPSGPPALHRNQDVQFVGRKAR